MSMYKLAAGSVDDEDFEQAVLGERLKDENEVRMRGLNGLLVGGLASGVGIPMAFEIPDLYRERRGRGQGRAVSALASTLWDAPARMVGASRSHPLLTAAVLAASSIPGTIIGSSIAHANAADDVYERRLRDSAALRLGLDHA